MSTVSQPGRLCQRLLVSARPPSPSCWGAGCQWVIAVVIAPMGCPYNRSHFLGRPSGGEALCHTSSSHKNPWLVTLLSEYEEGCSCVLRWDRSQGAIHIPDFPEGSGSGQTLPEVASWPRSFFSSLLLLPQQITHTLGSPAQTLLQGAKGF